VFFGAMDYARLGLTERVLTVLPAGRELLPQGDFRRWEEVDAWATGIANALAHEPAAP
jgi:menaquinone-dependent protoporphyrinogen oxidase